MAAARRDALGELGRARTALGLSVEQAAAQTRIPQRYLEALEKGDHSVFPPGPFLGGYTRQYRAFLRLPEAPAPSATPAEPEYTVTEPARPGRKSRRQAARLAVIGALALTAAVLLVAVSQEIWEEVDPEPGVPTDQRVTLRAPEPVRVRASVDGREAHTGELTPLSAEVFDAHDRVELDLESLDGVQITYNNQALKPLGATSRPRRLVFIDDLEP